MNINDKCTEKRNKELDKRRDKRESLECNENMVSKNIYATTDSKTMERCFALCWSLPSLVQRPYNGSLWLVNIRKRLMPHDPRNVFFTKSQLDTN